MPVKHPKPTDPIQRVQVELVSHRQSKRVRIRLESHDEQLGWYTSGSLSLPIQQLPLLEQAVAEIRSRMAGESAPAGNIIPLPRSGQKSR